LLKIGGLMPNINVIGIMIEPKPDNNKLCVKLYAMNQSLGNNSQSGTSGVEIWVESISDINVYLTTISLENHNQFILIYDASCSKKEDFLKFFLDKIEKFQKADLLPILISIGTEQSVLSEEIINQVSVIKEINNTENHNVLLKNIVTQELRKIGHTYRAAPIPRPENPEARPNFLGSRIEQGEHLRGINMHILGGFLSALGIAAVSLAFAALNLATLGTSGLIVGALGLISLGAGVGFFAVGRKRSNNEIELSPEQNISLG
jgi:hypothetical protein